MSLDDLELGRCCPHRDQGGVKTAATAGEIVANEANLCWNSLRVLFF
ncbi:hypothetical protein [Desulfothermobacter acidiphilus]